MVAAVKTALVVARAGYVEPPLSGLNTLSFPLTEYFDECIFMSTVMVVDDSVTLREMIADLLKGRGLNVTVASDGVEALEQIKANRPDLVVLDIVMPRMNGYEVCRRLKSDPKTQNLPVVMCSSKSEEFDRYWGMKQGADAYIAKPFHPQELVGTIKQLLRG
jgi:twitching motility two-component system response regulator PilH